MWVGAVTGRRKAAEPAAALRLGYLALVGLIAVTAVYAPGRRRRAALDAIADFIASSGPQRRRLRAALPTMLKSWRYDGVDAQIRDRFRELDCTYRVVDNAITLLSPDSRYAPGRPGPATYLRLDRDGQGSRRRHRLLERLRRPPPDILPWIVQHVLAAADAERAVPDAQADAVDRFAGVERLPMGINHVGSRWGAAGRCQRL